MFRLGRELGILRRRSSQAGIQQRLQDYGAESQKFGYLIIIDFESTCWENDRITPQEIIEFPAVLLNTKSGLVEDIFHSYVMPIEKPVLSKFCSEFTGISQAQVENGIPISICLSKFSRWLDKLCIEKKMVVNQEKEGFVQCAFATWTDWDLGVCLFNECRTKQLRRPSSMNSWIDIKKTYQRFYQRKPQGLNGALQDIGIEFQGRQHSGVDDAKNTAKLTWKMITDGCIFDITKSLNKVNETKTKVNEQNLKNSHKMEECKCQVNGAMHENLNDGFFDDLDLTDPIFDAQSSNSSPSRSPPIKRLSLPGTNDVKIRHEERHSGSPFRKGTQRTRLPICVTNIKSGSTVSHVKLLPNTSTQKQGINNSNDQIKRTSCNSKIPIPTSSSLIKEVLPLSPIQKIGRHGEICDHDKVTESQCLSASPIIKKVQRVKESDKMSVIFSQKSAPASKCLNFTVYCDTMDTAENRKKHSIIKNVSKFENHRTPIKDVSNITPNENRNTMKPLSKEKLTPSNYITPQFKTPYPVKKTPPQFKTPYPVKKTPCPSPISASKSAKVTPPFCTCGRRSKRKIVQNPGPNNGRTFFSCPLNNCKFYKFEDTIMKQIQSSASPVFVSSGSGCSRITGSLMASPVLKHSYYNKKSLGVRPNFSKLYV